MNDAKHTPGPWEVVDTSSQIVGKMGLHGALSVISRQKLSRSPSEYYGYGYLIAESLECEEIGPDGDKEMPLANARLIAAAPELLEALEAMLHTELVTKPNNLDEFEIRADVLEQAREAIRKAKGLTDDQPL